MRQPTIRQLHAVLAVHRLGKVNLAARELGLTPPAVTLQIQQAEADLNSALFDRTRDGFRATAAGLAVVAAAQAIDARLNQLADELAAARETGRGILRFGAVSTAKYFAPQLAAAFMAEFPGIDVRLRIGNRAAVIADLVDITRLHTADAAHRVPHLAFQPNAMSNIAVLPMSEVVTSYYLRLRVADETGVLAKVTGILAAADISIDAVLQREADEIVGVAGSGQPQVPQTDVIILTHDCVEAAMNAAIAQMQALPSVLEPITRIRKEELA